MLVAAFQVGITGIGVQRITYIRNGLQLVCGWLVGRCGIVQVQRACLVHAVLYTGIGQHIGKCLRDLIAVAVICAVQCGRLQRAAECKAHLLLVGAQADAASGIIVFAFEIVAQFCIQCIMFAGAAIVIIGSTLAVAHAAVIKCAELKQGAFT